MTTRAGWWPLDSVLYSALNIAAAAFVLYRAYKVRAERWPCLLIGAGMATPRPQADVVYAVWVPSGQMPSVADPLYLAFYPLVYAGMVMLMRDRLKRVPTAFRLDALICGLTLGALAAAIATGPIDAALQGEPAAVMVGLAYPVGDLLLLALTAGMLPILGWRAELRWGLMIAGFMAYRGRRYHLSLSVDRRARTSRARGSTRSGRSRRCASPSRVGCRPPAPPPVRNPVLQPMFRPFCVAGSRWRWP